MYPMLIVCYIAKSFFFKEFSPHLIYAKSCFQEYLNRVQKQVVSEYLFGVKSLFFNEKLAILRVVACIRYRKFIPSRILIKLKQIFISRTYQLISRLDTVLFY